MQRVCMTFLLISILALPAQAARSEYVLGGETGNPWTAALSENPGSYAVFGNDGALLDSLPVTVPSLSVGADTLLDYSQGGIRPILVDPFWNLARSLDLGRGKVTSSQHWGYLDAHMETIVLSFDGDPKTATFRTFRQDPSAPPGIGDGWRENIVVDFGADMPINRIRFFPRLGVDDMLLVEDMAEPKPDPELFGEVSFSANYVEWYEISVADNLATFSPNPYYFPPGTSWFRSTQNFGSVNDSRFTSLHRTTENLDVVTDYSFPLRHERYVAIRPINPLRNWEFAEIEVYGEGYVRKSVYLSHVLDFGQTVSWGKIRWAGDLPVGTRVEIRTRTGTDPHPNLYWDRSSITGENERIPFEEYEQIRLDRRQPPTYDEDNWSFWSPPYDFYAGLRDEAQPADSWQDGTALLSPSPSRYLQFKIVFYTTKNTAPQLDGLWLQFAQSPSASELVGEIWPTAVSSFDPQTFTYVVRPAFEDQDTGFDRLEILTFSRSDTVRSVKINGIPVDQDAFPPQIEDDRFTVSFPQLNGAEDNLKQVEVEFDAPVLRFGAEFKGWVFNSEDPDRMKQQVAPGNATFRYAGDVLSVRTDVGGDLLLTPEVAPNPFTPNGDGINDVLNLSFKVREVAKTRLLEVGIYDLKGRRIHTFTPREIITGLYSYTWEGLDEAGERVPPGLYLYQIELEGDDEKIVKTGTVAVAY